MSKQTKEAEKKQSGFRLDGADGPLEIPPGEYYINTKARARRLMLNSLSADSRRVYACLELATMGFQRERAVTMERGKKRDLTPADICDQTGMSRQHVRAGLVELEAAGLAERRAEDGGKLRKGQIVLYCWATPREPGTKNCSRAQLQFPAWFPQEWEALKPLITRRKLLDSLNEESARSYIQEGIELARSYQELEIVAARFLERVCAPAQSEPANRKKEPKETQRNLPPPPPPSVSSGADEDEDSRQSKGTPKPNTKPTGPPAGAALVHALHMNAKPELDTLIQQYPAARLDQSKTEAQWKRLPAAERQKALDALPTFVTCERWTQTPQFIPFASNWLARREYQHNPPPSFQAKSKDSDFGMSRDERKRVIAEAEAKEAARRNGEKV